MNERQATERILKKETKKKKGSVKKREDVFALRGVVGKGLLRHREERGAEESSKTIRPCPSPGR